MIIRFKKDDLFFTQVLLFYSTWVGYHLMHAKERHEQVSGRLRGFVVPQLLFENDPIAGKLQRQEEVELIEFQVDLTAPPDPIGTRVKSAPMMASWCQQMFGDAYEAGKPAIAARFGTEKERKDKWPSPLQFAYHIRNGCFHGNRFNIRAGAISPTIPTIWRGRTIDYGTKGVVAGEFFGPADFIMLLHDAKELVG